MDHLTPIHRAVLATDGSGHAHAAAGFAGALAWPRGATISVASIVEVPNPSDVAISCMAGKGVEDWRRVLELSHFAARRRTSPQSQPRSAPHAMDTTSICTDMAGQRRMQ